MSLHPDAAFFAGLKIGRRSADLILVDLEQPRLQPFHSPGQLVHAGSGADVRTVIVGGRLVVHERQLRTMDLDETLERVRSLAGRIGS